MPTLSRTLATRDLKIDLEAEAFRLRRMPSLARDGRAARTLVKDGPVRLTLVALASRGRIPEHSAAGPILIQPVWGEMTVEVEGEPRVLERGDLLTVEGGVEHAVHTGSGAVFTLTVVMPGRVR